MALEAQEHRRDETWWTSGGLLAPFGDLRAGAVMGEQGRVAHVLERLAFHRTEQQHVGRSLCSTAVEVVEVPGAAIMLVNAAGTVHPVGVCGATMEAVEELQLVHGEGPCIDAHHLGRPVVEPDLAHPEALRWVGFSQPAVAAGAGAVFGFPLHIGSVCIGALNLCAEQPGALTADQHRDALVLADVAIVTLLSAQEESPPGELSWDLVDDSAHQVVVHQATGMVAVQLETDLVDAFARLRAHAFMSGRRLSAVAGDIVARRLRMEP